MSANLFRALFIPLLLGFSASAQIIIHPGEMLRLDFYFQGQPVDKQYGTSDPAPDMFLFNVVGNAPFSETSTLYQLYDGGALLSQVKYDNSSFTWVGLNYVSSSNPFPYFNGLIPNQLTDMSRIVDGTIEGRINFVPQFTSPSPEDAMNVTFIVALGLQGGIGGYRPYTDPIVSYSVVQVPEPELGLLPLLTALAVWVRRSCRTRTFSFVTDLLPRRYRRRRKSL